MCHLLLRRLINRYRYKNSFLSVKYVTMCVTHTNTHTHADIDLFSLLELLLLIFQAPRLIQVLLWVIYKNQETF